MKKTQVPKTQKQKRTTSDWSETRHRSYTLSLILPNLLSWRTPAGDTEVRLAALQLLSSAGVPTPVPTKKMWSGLHPISPRSVLCFCVEYFFARSKCATAMSSKLGLFSIHGTMFGVVCIQIFKHSKKVYPCGGKNNEYLTEWMNGWKMNERTSSAWKYKVFLHINYISPI